VDTGTRAQHTAEGPVVATFPSRAELLWPPAPRVPNRELRESGVPMWSDDDERESYLWSAQSNGLLLFTNPTVGRQDGTEEPLLTPLFLTPSLGDQFQWPREMRTERESHLSLFLTYSLDYLAGVSQDSTRRDAY
jgi:hypothetical protein